MRRLQAGLVDLAMLFIWLPIIIGITAVLLYLGLTAGLNQLLVYAVATFTAILVPVVVFSLLDSGRNRGTWGKRRFQMQVVRLNGERLGLGRALARNFLRYALPLAFLALGIAAMLTRPGLDSWIAVAIAAVFPIVYVLSIWFGSGRSLYDSILDTQVVPASGRRAIFEPGGRHFEESDDLEDEGEETIILPRRAIPPGSV
ncbi:MAG: RDD family protein [Propionibacteriaceae bacterium]|jgi:uncharacterized RDD family membrane protein YckC|nr:RDD family protein [Propionibacteriaceae bacterium]